MPTLYTAEARYDLSGTDDDFSRFDAVEAFLTAGGLGTDAPHLVALAVLDDGRVVYHYRAGLMAFNCDMLESVGQGWQRDFESIIDRHRLNIISFDIPGRPWICDVALGASDAPPLGGYPTDLLRGTAVLR